MSDLSGTFENGINLFEAMYTARAMRWLKTDPIPDELLQQVLQAAIQAPNPAIARTGCSWSCAMPSSEDASAKSIAG